MDAKTQQQEFKKNPTLFIERVFEDKLWDKQIDIVNSVRDNLYTVVQSCYGSGKSYTAARVALWYLYTHVPSKVICTSSSWDQVEKILFSEIGTAYNKSKLPLGGDLLATNLKLEKDWFITGVSPKINVDQEATRFEGYHSPNVLVILDQSQGLNPKLWDVATALVSNERSRILVLGNPTSPSGKFYEACTNSGLWHKIKISAFDTPNIKQGKEIVPGLVTQIWLDARTEEWGKVNPLYITKVLANFPEEANDILIPLTWVEMAKQLIMKAEGAIGLGVDVARFGNSDTVFTVIKGNKVIEIYSYQGRDTMETAGNVKRFIRKYGIPDKAVCIDDTGVGGGVTDRLHDDGWNVIPINNQNKAEDSEHFYNISAEIHYTMRRLFENNNIDIPDHPKLVAQLSGRKYFVKAKGKGVIQIESKQDMKARGLKSPDYADSLALAIKAQSLADGTDDDGPMMTVIES